jgi:hypothetical protein
VKTPLFQYWRGMSPFLIPRKKLATKGKNKLLNKQYEIKIKLSFKLRFELTRTKTKTRM